MRRKQAVMAFRRLDQRRLLLPVVIFLIIMVVGLFLTPHLSFAGAPFYSPSIREFVSDPIGFILKLLAQIILGIASFIGGIVLTLIGILVEVAQFNNFIDAPAVVKGWVIVRDVSNMFFIIILLLIAFGSVFRLEEYQYKKILGKLLVMAVLINFSRAICGIFIDIAQVVMLTFVSGFKEAAAGNFINGFHLKEIFTFAEVQPNASGGQGFSELAQAGTYTAFDLYSAAMMALVSIIITAIVVGVYLVVFLLRIVALWFLIIISPIAYLLSAFPGEAKKYSSQWWDYFGKYTSTGPILAFFLWLSLAVMQFGQNVMGGFNVSKSQYSIPAAAITNIGSSEVLLSFIINIILLIGGLWMTQQLGVAGGKLAGSAINKIQSAGMAIGKGAFKAATYLPREYGKRIGYGVADAGLAVAARIPLVGTSATIARAKLRMKREYQEEKQTRYLRYMSDSERERIIRSKMRVPAILQTEKGRAIMKTASEYQMKTGKTVASAEARRLIRQGAQTNDPRVIAANRAFNTRFIQRARVAAGHRINNDNEDIYRDNEAGEVIEKYIKKNPHLIEDTYDREVTIGPGRGAVLGSQRQFTLERLENDDIVGLSYGALQDNNFMNQLYGMLTTRTQQREANRNALIANLMVQGVRDLPGLIDRVGNAIAPDENFYREQWRGIHSLRSRSNRNSAAIDQTLQSFINNSPPSARANVAAGAYSGRYGGADIDKSKFKNTKELIEKHSKEKKISLAEASISFEGSEEYKAAPNKYYSRDEYYKAQSAMADSKIANQENKDLDSISGVKGTIRKAHKAEEKGEKLDEARVATDFEKFGLSGRGVALRGQAKTDFLAKLIEYLKETKEYTEEQLSEFQKAVEQADQLTVLNKGRTLGEARHLMAHERAHAVGDVNPEAVQELWNTVPDEQKSVIREEIRKFENNPDLNEDDIAHEYWAEAIANETRWRDDSSGITLNDKGREVIRKFSGTEKDSAEHVLTSDKFTAAPNSLTRPEIQITPQQLLQAISQNDPSIKTDDQGLINALQHLADELGAVGPGLRMLSEIGNLPVNLSKALDAYAKNSKQSLQEIIQRLRINDTNYSQTNKELRAIIKDYKTQPNPVIINQTVG